MKALPTIPKAIFAAIVFFAACNDSAKSKKDSIEKDSPVATAGLPTQKDTSPPPPPIEPPPGVEMLPATLCFENDGLKYALQVRIEYITTDKATVEVNSTDLGSNKKVTSTFTCEIKDNQLLVKSISNLPLAGDASQWIPNKNWVIDANKPKQTLLIPFKAKNYETNKWVEMNLSFDPCQ
jgi:hypothetical protein